MRQVSCMAQVVLASGLLVTTGCTELNLGDVPFYCNNGRPTCPEGYVCVGGKGGVCVREGVALPGDGTVKGDTRHKDGKVVRKDSGQDRYISQKDQLPVDGPKKPDWYVPPPDGPVKPKDTGGTQPHLGCQNNAECKLSDPTYPCCCLTIPSIPPIPAIWACLPFCLNPLCF